MKLIRIFTFQYGEIKRTKNPAEAGLIILFTFQYGEIKRRVARVYRQVEKGIYIPVWRD